MSRGRALAVVAVSCVMLAASPVGASDAEPPALEPVITPGQEALIAGMLGKGMALPDCRLVRCAVAHDVVVATYGCVDGDVTLELGHPQNATDASVLTERFAITTERGTPPAELQEALVLLVRSREADFVWAWQEAAADEENGDAPE